MDVNHRLDLHLQLELSIIELLVNQLAPSQTTLEAFSFSCSQYLHFSYSELLLGAMRTTHTQGALQSLTLQREYHLKQDAVVRQKQRHAIIAQKKSKKPRPNSGGLQDHVDAPVTNGDTSESDVRFAARIANQMADNIETCPDGTVICRTMEECDSLLQMLNHRGHEDEKSNGEKKGDVTPRQQTNGTKVPKDDKVIIEELRMHNIALCTHIVDLLKEIEQNKRQMQHYKSENDELKDKLNRHDTSYNMMEDSTDSEKYYPVPVGMNLHDLPSLELPPLEMPKFDFSALKIDSEEPQD